MKDITAIILTLNEEKHLERCLKSLKPFVKRICIVDSYSTDRTVEIAHSNGAEVFQHEWKNYATQFQWGLDNCNIKTAFTMRMDADEHCEPQLIDEINIKFDSLATKYNAFYLKRKLIFRQQWIRWGGIYPLLLLRIWRTGAGHIESRWMDEHIVVKHMSAFTLTHNIIDENLNDITWWTDKHNAYATREMIDMLIRKYGIAECDASLIETADPQAKVKRLLKERVYLQMPEGIRAFVYFFIRYVIQLGFLDGIEGFRYHVLQGLWYRMLVDVKFNEAVGITKGNKKEIIEYLQNRYKISINTD